MPDVAEIPRPAMQPAPRIVVLVVTYNGAEYVADCFSSLEHASYPKDSLGILVVDNASTDDTVARVRARHPDVTIIQSEKNLGFAGGNNVGLRYALEHNADFIYLLNQDTVVAPDFLRESVAVALGDPRRVRDKSVPPTDEKQIGAVQSKLLLHGEPDRINSIGNQIHFLGFGYAGGYREPDREMEVAEIPYASGACVLLRATALRDSGLFCDDLFLYHEDLDLGWQLRLAGYRILLAPQSIVYHKYQYIPSLTKYYYMERNRCLTLAHNYKAATWALIALPFLAMQIAMLVYSILAGFWREELRAWAYFLRPGNWRRIWARRREVQRRRKARDRDVVRFFTGKVEFVELRSRVLKYVVNPVFNAYWQIARRLMWW